MEGHGASNAEAVIAVPDSFVVEVVRQRGELGRRWLAGLPGLVAELRASWHLDVVDEPVRHGANAIVVPVERDGQRCVLKVSWHPSTVANEAVALTTWGGHGSVELFDAEPSQGALLLEQLDADRTLRGVDVRFAAALAGELIGRLDVPAPQGIPMVTSYGVELADSLAHRNRAFGSAVPRRWVDQATTLARELAADAGSSLVHADLHYDNILAGVREPWLAVDPHAVSGDPEQSVPELMWTRIDELDDSAVRALLDVIVDAGRLDADKALAWTIVRAVDYWLWGLPIGLTIDPARCQRLLTIVTSA